MTSEVPSPASTGTWDGTSLAFADKFVGCAICITRYLLAEAAHFRYRRRPISSKATAVG